MWYPCLQSCCQAISFEMSIEEQHRYFEGTGSGRCKGIGHWATIVVILSEFGKIPIDIDLMIHDQVSVTNRDDLDIRTRAGNGQCHGAVRPCFDQTPPLWDIHHQL